MGEETVRGLRTRRHAVWLGVAVFSLTTLAIFALGWLLAHKRPSSELSLANWEFRKIARALAACLPLSAFVGLLSGFDAYRYAAGARVPCTPLVLAVLSIPSVTVKDGVFVGVLFGAAGYGMFQLMHRAVITGESPPQGLLLAAIYGTVLAVLAPLTASDWTPLADKLSWMSLIGLLISDTLVVGQVRVWAVQQRIDRETGARLQFSLGALLFLVFSWGLYLALMAWMFQNKMG